MIETNATDPYQPGTYVRTTYRLAGHQDMFLITARDGTTVRLENALTGHSMSLHVRELHDPQSWVPVITTPD